MDVKVKYHEDPLAAVLDEGLTQEQLEHLKDVIYPDVGEFKRDMMDVVLSTSTAWKAAAKAKETLRDDVTIYSLYRVAQQVRTDMYEELTGVDAQWWWDELVKNDVVVGIPPEMVRKLREQFLTEDYHIEQIMAVRLVRKEE